MLAGIAVSLTASILSGVPVWRAERRAEPSSPIALLGSLAARFFFALSATAYLLLNRMVVGPPFLIWLGLSYLLLLPLDVLYALRRNQPPVQSDSPDGAPSA